MNKKAFIPVIFGALTLPIIIVVAIVAVLLMIFAFSTIKALGNLIITLLPWAVLGFVLFIVFKAITKDKGPKSKGAMSESDCRSKGGVMEGGNCVLK